MFRTLIVTSRVFPSITPWWDTEDAETKVPSADAPGLLQILSCMPAIAHIALHATPADRNSVFPHFYLRDAYSFLPSFPIILKFKVTYNNTQ